MPHDFRNGGTRLERAIATEPDLTQRDIGFKVLISQGAAIDTTKLAGKLTFGIFAALAEFERELIFELTKTGLASARGTTSDPMGGLREDGRKLLR